MTIYCVQVIVYLLRDGGVNARNFLQLFNIRVLYSLRTAKMPQQYTPALTPHARDIFQRRALAGLITPTPVTSNGETVCLIADLLD